VHRSEASPLANRSNPAMRRSSVEALTVTPPQNRAFTAFADDSVDRSRRSRNERDVAGLLPLPRMRNVR
jgi:hypothetical protein